MKTKHNLVQKSNYLQEAFISSKYSLLQYKVLDLYLSEIDIHDETNCSVMIPLTEFKDILHLGHNKDVNEILDDSLSQMMRIIVKLGDHRDQEGNIIINDRISLFEQSNITIDKNGKSWVFLKCTSSAKKYIFNIDKNKIPYFRYKLNVVSQLRSVYSYNLFNLLESHRYAASFHEGTFIMTVDEVFHALGFPDGTYGRNSNITIQLERYRKELEKRAEYKFSFEPIRVGRKFQKIKFTLDSAIPELLDKDLSKDELKGITPNEYELTADSVKLFTENKLNDKEIKEAIKLINSCMEYKTEYERACILKGVYVQCTIRDNVKNFSAYFFKSLQNAIVAEKKKKDTTQTIKIPMPNYETKKNTEIDPEIQKENEAFIKSLCHFVEEDKNEEDEEENHEYEDFPF